MMNPVNRGGRIIRRRTNPECVQPLRAVRSGKFELAGRVNLQTARSRIVSDSTNEMGGHVNFPLVGLINRVRKAESLALDWHFA